LIRKGERFQYAVSSIALTHKALEEYMDPARAAVFHLGAHLWGGSRGKNFVE